jgi:hypothetical protein
MRRREFFVLRWLPPLFFFYFLLSVKSATAITADELLLKELAWAETRIRMYRHGFGNLSSSSSSSSGEPVHVDAGALMSSSQHDPPNRAGASGAAEGPRGGSGRGVLRSSPA